LYLQWGTANENWGGACSICRGGRGEGRKKERGEKKRKRKEKEKKGGEFPYSSLRKRKEGRTSEQRRTDED
jgi:hypothetical protein